MTYNETASIVYRVASAYPLFAKNISEQMLENMVREWHEGLKTITPDGAMEAVTTLITEQKWMPSLSEVISKILDKQYGTDSEIIKKLDYVIATSSNCIIFGQVTDEQREGFERLSNFQKLIVKSPYEFNLWLTKDHEWKADRVKLVKREIQGGRHQDYLNGNQQEQLGSFNVFKALEERNNG